MAKKLEEVFDIPKQKECAEKCGCGKPPNKMDPELQTEIDKYLNSIKTEIATSKPKQQRKHTLTPEGKEKMLSNIQKAREVRRLNLEKSKAQEPPKQVETQHNQRFAVEVKKTPEANNQRFTPETKAPEQPNNQRFAPEQPKPSPVIQPVAVPIAKPTEAPKAPYIIKSSFKRAPWVK